MIFRITARESYLVLGLFLKFAFFYATGSLESHCALMKGVGSDVHELLYRPEPI